MVKQHINSLKKTNFYRTGEGGRKARDGTHYKDVEFELAVDSMVRDEEALRQIEPTKDIHRASSNLWAPSVHVHTKTRDKMHQQGFDRRHSHSRKKHSIFEVDGGSFGTTMDI